MKRLPFNFSGRAAIVTALILAVGVPTTAMGFGEGRTLLLGKRNPSSDASKALTTETEIIANNSTYGTRQSNKGSGGGAIYGCRAPSATGAAACVRANNLNGGQAFQFNTTGTTAGSITVGNTSGAPFTTNATGVATGLNADKVDGKSATDFASASDLQAESASLLFAQVGADGTLGANKRGATAASKGSGNTFTVTFNRDVSKCSATVTPIGTAQPATQLPGVQATSGHADQISVDFGAASTSFNLQVIC